MLSICNSCGERQIRARTASTGRPARPVAAHRGVLPFVAKPVSGEQAVAVAAAHTKNASIVQHHVEVTGNLRRDLGNAIEVDDR